VVPISSNRPTAQQAELAPVWKLTEEQFLAAGNTSMSVPELANRLNEKGVKVARKTIRVAMGRKPEIFVSSGEYGKFRLRSFPADAQIQHANGGH
jgi:hypothetical protein